MKLAPLPLLIVLLLSGCEAPTQPEPEPGTKDGPPIELPVEPPIELPPWLEADDRPLSFQSHLGDPLPPPEVVSITGTDRWRAVPTAAWLDVLPPDGMGAGQITVRIAPGRTVGELRGAVVVMGEHGDTARVPVTLTRTAPPPERLAYTRSVRRPGESTERLVTFTVPVGGGEPVEFMEGIVTWSWSGDRIAVVTHEPWTYVDGQFVAAQYEVWIGNPDGTGLFRVSPDVPQPDFSSARWLPDGRLYFADVGSAYYTVRADGTELRQITSDYPCRSFSPEGRRCASSSGSPEVTVAYLNGEVASVIEVPPVHGWPAYCCSIEWHPSGTRLLIEAGHPSVHGHISDEWERFLVDLESGVVKRLLWTRMDTPTLPVWSPDASTLAFDWWEGDPWEGHEARGLWVMDADGGNRRQLVAEGPVAISSGSPDAHAVATTAAGAAAIPGSRLRISLDNNHHAAPAWSATVATEVSQRWWSWNQG